MNSFSVILPCPPSVNHCWKSSGRGRTHTYLTKEARDWKESALLEILDRDTHNYTKLPADVFKKVSGWDDRDYLVKINSLNFDLEAEENFFELKVSWQV